MRQSPGVIGQAGYSGMSTPQRSATPEVVQPDHLDDSWGALVLLSMHLPGFYMNCLVQGLRSLLSGMHERALLRPQV